METGKERVQNLKQIIERELRNMNKEFAVLYY